MRSPRKRLIEQIHELVDDGNRYRDCAVQIRVWRRGTDGKAHPAEILPRSFGGVYDRFTAHYTDARPRRIVELRIHPGQLPVLEHIGRKGVRRVLALGAPGGGKTMAIVVTAIILAVRRSNAMVGVVAPTRGRLDILWRKLLEVLEPAGLIEGKPSDGRREIRLVNGSVFQCRATARKSAATGSPLAGNDWHDAVEDEQQDQANEDQLEVDARLRINASAQVFSSATNVSRHEFQTRLQEYASNPEKAVLRFSGPDNAFTALEHWDALKRNWSAEDYDRYINCKDAPREGRVFPAFDYTLNTCGLPPTRDDITARLTFEKFQAAYPFVIGWDPGSMISASTVMKAYAAPGVGERNWFVLDEVTTKDATTEYHARDLMAWLNRRGIPQASCLVIGDPHENKDTDRSDYLQMQAAGFHVRRSNNGAQIERKHRIAMTNALLKDATDRRRLYLVASSSGPPCAQKTAECFGQLMYRPNGEIDYHHKSYANQAHWGEAVGYALFPFEHFRGAYKAKTVEDMSSAASRARRHLGS